MKAILFSERHSHPSIDGCEPIFDEINPVDFVSLDQGAKKFIMAHEDECRNDGLDLYVTGLTPALCAVIRQCLNLGIELRLWHYDRDLGDYICQPMIAIGLEEQAADSYGVNVPYAPHLK